MGSLQHIAHSTYGRVSRAKEHGAPGPSPQLAAQRAVQDTVMAEQHRQFDLSAKDNHAKYERASFIVVGEGSHDALDAYRTNYERIDWSA